LHCSNDAFVIDRLHRFRANFVRPISFSLVTPILSGGARSRRRSIASKHVF
jgi:hypothetical protein